MNAAELLRELETCALTGAWSSADAGLWWAGRTRPDAPGAATVVAAKPDAMPGPGATVVYQRPERGQ